MWHNLADEATCTLLYIGYANLPHRINFKYSLMQKNKYIIVISDFLADYSGIDMDNAHLQRLICRGNCVFEWWH